MSTERKYSSKRQSIVRALAKEMLVINGSGEYLTNLEENVHPTLKFWDDIEEFPAIHINAGSETREYLGGGMKHRFLQLTIRIYVNEEDSVDALDLLIEDVETLIETVSRMSYFDKSGGEQFTQQMTIISIDTDEGVLDPLGVGEMIVEVRY